MRARRARGRPQATAVQGAPSGLDMGAAGEDLLDSSRRRLSSEVAVPMQAGWIDVPICEAILTNSIRILVSVDGSDNSMVALHFVSEGMMQADKTAFVEILHVYDDTKTYLPVKCRKDALKMTVESTMTVCASSKRYKITWVNKVHADGPFAVGELICRTIAALPADYVCMGFYGLKGKKDGQKVPGGGMLSSNVLNVLSLGNSCSLICIKDEDPKDLPLRDRKAVFVVSVSLNKSSTKAFLDALRLSKPGDEIHVVYIKSYMEREESDYTAEVRAKYEAFFSGLKDGAQEVFSQFQDRSTKFVLEPKQRRETTPQAVVRYADDVEGDFIVVGANAHDRVSRGKKPVGSVSLQICLLTTRNFIVANWVDVIPRVYENHVRRAQTPSGMRR